MNPAIRRFAVGAAPLACLAAVSLYTLSGPQQSPAAGTAANAVHRIDELRLGDTRFVRREILASSYRYDKQQFPAIDLADDGSFVVAWESRRQHHGYSGVYAQDFDASGHRRGEEIEVEAGPRLHQKTAALARGAHGTWVAWESFDLAGDGPSVRLRKLGSDASVKLDNGDAHHVALTQTEDGLVAAWVNRDGERERAFYARFAADGTPLTQARRLTDADENGLLPGLATLADGGFVAVWAAQSTARRPDGLRYRVFDAQGEARGPVRSLHGSRPSASIEPSVAAGGDGGFVVAWLDNGQGDNYDVRARRFDAAGEPLTATLMISRGERHQSGATVAVARDGTDRFCVAWNLAEDERCKTYDVRARLFDAAGAAISEPFTVSSHTAGNQKLLVAANRRAIAFGPAGQLLFAWTGDADLGDEHGVHVTMCVPTGSTLAAAVADVAPDLPASRQPEAAAVSLPIGLLTDADTQTQDLQIAGAHEPPVFTGHIPQQTGGRSDPLNDSGYAGISNTGWTPPDTHGTVGPTQVVEVVNGGIRIFDKLSGAPGAFTSINNFWAPVGSQTFVFDPRVMFDPHSGRFIAIASEHVGSSAGYLVVAVSTTDSPTNLTSHWHKYRFDVTADALGYFIDFPHVGIDDKAVYLATNNFNATFNHMIYILDKAPMLIGAAPPPRKLIRVNGGANASMALAVHYGANNAAFGINEGNGSSTLTLYAIRNPIGAGAATLTSFTLGVPSFAGGPTDAPQIGTSNRLDSIDKRFSSAVVRNGRLYAAHNWGNPTRCRWYEIDLNNWPVSGSPTLVQSGDLLPSGAFAIIPSIAVDAYGNLLMNFTRSSANETPSMRRTARKASDPAGQMPDRDIAIISPASYTVSRWGDYSHVAVDPRDQATFYYFHEYAPGSSSWGTWIGHYRVQGPTFTADKTTMSTSILDTVTFTLDNPPWAGEDYLVLVGASGRTPGFRLPSAPGVINVDLVPDGLTQAVLVAPNSPPFGNFFGQLDGSGQATATFTLPPLPVLNGITFEFAYVQRQGGEWNFASETLSVLMVP